MVTMLTLFMTWPLDLGYEISAGSWLSVYAAPWLHVNTQKAQISGNRPLPRRTCLDLASALNSKVGA